VPANGAILAGMLGVYPHDPPTSLFRFVGEDSEKLRPARILHPFGGAGAGQPEDVQVFMNDGSIAVDQMPGQLVVEVFALVGDFAVQLGQLPLQLPVSVGTFPLPGQSPLGAGQFGLRLLAPSPPRR